MVISMFFIQYILPSIIAIIVAFIAFLSNWSVLSIRIKKDFEAQKRQYELDNNRHVKNLHYEEKYKIYQSLSEKSLLMLKDSVMLFPPFFEDVPDNKEEQKKFYINLLNKASESYNDFIITFFSCASFVDRDVYDFFINVKEQCRFQITNFPIVKIKPIDNDILNNYELSDECCTRGFILGNMSEKICDFLKSKIKEEEKITI